MRIGNLNTNVNFKQIKMDGDSYWDLRNTSSEEAVDSIKDMSLKGFNLGYITCNDSGLFLRGIQSREGKSCCIYLGERPTAQDVRNAINNYNKYA